jgi:ABC-type transporter lipoprotein component MlaA
MTDHIQKSCSLSFNNFLTIIYEYIVACVAQMYKVYAKNNFIKYMLQSFLLNEHKRIEEVNILQTSFEKSSKFFLQISTNCYLTKVCSQNRHEAAGYNPHK